MANPVLVQRAWVNEENKNEEEKEKRLTPYARLCHELSSDERYMKEITLGKRIGFYRIRGELGSGNFCQVKMGIHALSKEKVAIKILDKTKLDQKTQRLLSREISSMEKVQHPNIIRLYEVIETLTKLHLVIEYASGGELFAKISNEGKLSEKTAKRLYAQVVSAVEHMHNNNIIHRDLKAENVFIAGPYLVKVGDFGFSTYSTPDDTLNTFCGSPPYAAPELFKDECYVGVHVDVWALGILLYFMVTGVMPFRAETVGKLKKVILEGTYFIPEFLSEDCKHLVRQLLRQTPTERMSVSDIKRSGWLHGEHYPKSDVKYCLQPNLVLNEKATADEKEAIKILNDLGVSSDMMSNCLDARSNISGTYRIVLHRVQRRKQELYRTPSIISTQNNTVPPRIGRSNRVGPKNKEGRSVTSKFCTIL